MATKRKHRPSYFLHIPKTGGTSLTSILDRFFEAKDIYHEQLWWNVGSIEKVKQSKYQFIRGHFGLAAQLLSQNKLNKWTMLRDPLSLAHSTYQYILREKNTKNHKKVSESVQNFDQFIQDSSMTHLVSNRLVKAFAFGLNVTDYGDSDYITLEHYKSFRKRMNRKRKAMGREHLLTQVKKQLDSMNWFGIQEDFEFSIFMLCHQMAWPPIGIMPKLNVSTKSLNISKKAADQLQVLNRLDCEFYQYAKRLYDQRKNTFLRQIGLSNSAELIDIEKATDDHYQKQYLELHGLSLNNCIKFDFSMTLLGKNWHQREWHEAEQFYFRWTGPDSKSTIDFWMQAANYKITIHVINSVVSLIDRNIKIHINDHMVDHKTNLEEGAIKLSLVCDKRIIKDNGLIRLTFSDVVTEIHDNQFNSGDIRKVGMAVKKIDIIQLIDN